MIDMQRRDADSQPAGIDRRLGRRHQTRSPPSGSGSRGVRGVASHIRRSSRRALGRRQRANRRPADHRGRGQGRRRLITLVTDAGDIPCWLLTPPVGVRRDLAVVAVAGHGGGIDDLVVPPGAGDFHGGLAHKLVEAGFTVLCPEMISFGRRRTAMPDTVPPGGSTCQVDGMRGLLTGRPVLGQRVTDTMAAVRALRTVEGVDPAKVAVIGGSGGGAIALLTAALDDQIPAAVVAAFLSSFVDSFCGVPHCICNAVPDLLTWFEMADIAAMIAPRRFDHRGRAAGPDLPDQCHRGDVRGAGRRLEWSGRRTT